MVRILAFDTTNEFTSVAIAENGKILANELCREIGNQSQIIVPKIEKLLGSFSIWYNDLDAVALTVGPGSFAGVRVGMSIAKGLKVATNLKFLCITCFDAIIYPYFCGEKSLNDAEKICVVMDARQGNLFVQMFNVGGDIVVEGKIIKRTELSGYLTSFTDEKVLIIGSAKHDALEILKNSYLGGVKEFIVSEEKDLIDAKNIAKLGYEKYVKSEFCSDIKPLYLRPPRICKRKK